MADGQPEQQPAPAAEPKWYKNASRLQHVIIGLVMALVAVVYFAQEIYQDLEQAKTASASVVRERDEAKKKVAELDRDLAKAKADATKAEEEAKQKISTADAARQKAEGELGEAKQKVASLEERLEVATKVAEKCEVAIVAKKPAAKPVTHAKAPRTTPKPDPKPAAKPEDQKPAPVMVAGWERWFWHHPDATPEIWGGASG
jgi:isoleucyl-tRNA synthetase